ncbi:MAG TPA: TetR/AcrR family transcriptional regulator [Acidimicrobiales bacterium]|jgi:AcrR family transcriptional regulator|nr:TetR/AcrR family transcriptional regulator [Acidimicrobiales bacterium]
MAATPRRKLSTRGGAPAQERELRAQGKKTMRKLLDAAMTVLEKRGYHAARVDDIVKVARTSHGTFYLYFANKEDLFRALLADVAEEVESLASTLGPVGPDEAGYRELRGWLGRFSDMYVHYGPVIRAWTEAEVEGDDVGRMGEQVLTTVATALITRIGEANDSADFDPQVAALATVAMVERLHYYLLSRQLDVPRDDLLDTLATVLHVGVFGGSRRRRRRSAS